jgi:hypothetical protein
MQRLEIPVDVMCAVEIAERDPRVEVGARVLGGLES